MTNKTIRTKLEVSGEINRLIQQGIEEQWTHSMFFKNVYLPILIERKYNTYLESYFRGWYDAHMHIIWHTLMNPVMMDNAVTWKSTGKVFCPAIING